MKYKTKIFVALIILTVVALAITSSWNDSLIVDEIPHIGAGYSYLAKQDMRLNPEHPPLAKDLAALPLLTLGLNQDAFKTKFWLEDLNGQWEFGRKLIFQSDNNAKLITRLVKLPMISFFIFSAIFVFLWGRKLYKDTGGLLALVLFSFSTTVLAHSRFVTTDMPALFGVLSATYFFVGWLEKQNKKNFFLAGLFLGIALLTKFSTFLLIPFFFTLFLAHMFVSKTVRHVRHRMFNSLGSFLLLLVLSFSVVWFIYALQMTNYPVERQYSDTTRNLETFGNRKLAEPVIWASQQPILQPLAQYSLGLLMVTQRSAGGNTTYFLGEVSRFGWWYYFPVVYFIKEPLAWWGLTIIALLSAMIKFSIFNFQFSKIRKWVQNHFAEFAMLLWLTIYWTTSLRSILNIGVRHLLPTYPFAILLVSGQLMRFIENLKLKIENYKTEIKVIIILVSVLLGWYILENLFVYPHYLTYFNQIAGSSSGGYRYVVDSNLDWGQDLKRFADWVKKNNIPKVELNYFGWADPQYYLGEKYVWTSSEKYQNEDDFKTNNQSDGWLAVSVSFLQASEGPPDQYKPTNYLWLKNHTPLTTIGNSIFVYRIK